MLDVFLTIREEKGIGRSQLQMMAKTRLTLATVADIHIPMVIAPLGVKPATSVRNSIISQASADLGVNKQTDVPAGPGVITLETRKPPLE